MEQIKVQGPSFSDISDSVTFSLTHIICWALAETKNAQGQARNIGSWSLTHLFQGNLSKVYRSLTLVLIHYVFMATCNYMGLYNGNKPQIEFKTRWFMVQTLVQASIMFPFNVFRSHLQLTKLTHSPGKRSLRRNPRLCPKRGPNSRSPKVFRHRFGRQNFVS